MLTTELDHVEERFAEIVAGLAENDAAWAKVRPINDPLDDGPSREEDLEPWDDEDVSDGGDIEFP